jgi:ketosteroid isomerase-like protein
VISQFTSMKEPELKLTPRKVLQAGDVALVVSDWTFSGKGPDGILSVSGTSTDVMRRQADGTWRYLIDNPDGVA